MSFNRKVSFLNKIMKHFLPNEIKCPSTYLQKLAKLKHNIETVKGQS